MADLVSEKSEKVVHAFPSAASAAQVVSEDLRKFSDSLCSLAHAAKSLDYVSSLRLGDLTAGGQIDG